MCIRDRFLEREETRGYVYGLYVRYERKGYVHAHAKEDVYKRQILLCVNWMVKKMPLITGGGIPQTRDVYKRQPFRL